MFYIFYLIFLVAVGIMADKRGRSVIGWVAFSLFLSPLAGGVLLLALGDSK